MRLLAGALVAELRGLMSRWYEIAPHGARQCRVLPVGAAEESYCSVYDSIGARLSLLPCDVAEEVVRVYIRVKALIDRLRVVASIRLAMSRIENAAERARAEKQALDSSEETVGYGRPVEQMAEQLIDRLLQISGRR